MGCSLNAHLSHGVHTQSPRVLTLRPERSARTHPPSQPEVTLMISIPLVMIVSLMAFIALIAGVAETRLQPRGAHRA